MSRIIIWREGDIPCADCHRPARYGWSDGNGRGRHVCARCYVARQLRGWRYTGTYSSARRKA